MEKWEEGIKNILIELSECKNEFKYGDALYFAQNKIKEIIKSQRRQAVEEYDKKAMFKDACFYADCYGKGKCGYGLRRKQALEKFGVKETK